jgi:Protein of unknown function (DUF2384)
MRNYKASVRTPRFDRNMGSSGETASDAKTASVPIERKLLEDVKGFVDDPEKWFRTPNADFEGRQPIELLGTDDEPRLRNRIEAAKLGMFS